MSLKSANEMSSSVSIFCLVRFSLHKLRSTTITFTQYPDEYIVDHRVRNVPFEDSTNWKWSNDYKKVVSSFYFGGKKCLLPTTHNNMVVLNEPNRFINATLRCYVVSFSTVYHHGIVLVWIWTISFVSNSWIYRNTIATDYSRVLIWWISWEKRANSCGTNYAERRDKVT